MKTLQEFMLTEKFVNMIGDDEKKEQYAQEVWDLLQSSYKSIGGLKGSGFSSIQDMINNIPFWKVSIKGGKVVAVMMYKDRGGRKFVASATDGSDIGKSVMIDIVQNDLKRSYGEKSKGALGLIMKSVPFDVLEHFLVPAKDVNKVSKDQIYPVKGMSNSDLPDDAKLSLNKFPSLIDYGYLRDIGGKMVFKVMMGTPRKTIK